MIVILIVDDCENDRMLVRQALNRSAKCFRIFAVSDISTAMAYVEGAQYFSDRTAYPPPDLILCDFHLTRENGLSLIEKINQRSASKRVGVALMSGAFSPEMRQLAEEKEGLAPALIRVIL